MRMSHLIVGFLCFAIQQAASASLLGDSVTGYAATLIPSISFEEIYFDTTATVGSNEEFSGTDSVGTTVVLEYYADLDESSITIGVRHLTEFAIVLSSNLLRFEFGSIDWTGPSPITGIELDSVFGQELWPNETDVNAKWAGWGEDTPTPPAWNPIWDDVNKTITIDATGGFTIPNGYDVWAKFNIVTAVPIPPAIWLFGSGLLGLIGIARRKKA